MPAQRDQGFTLIELSIVLVIIGLIVGGVLVGRNLIQAAEVRATISQIEKFNTATNTFRGKYGYLPGDIKNPDAVNFGFASRGQYAGEGDGNGVLEGVWANSGASNAGVEVGVGETVMFWEDLSAAHLIDGAFNTASPTTFAGGSQSLYLPLAKLGVGNYIYVWSNGSWGGSVWNPGGINYFGLSGVTGLGWGVLTSNVTLSVSEAYGIDKKIDDGLPQLGNVNASYVNTPTNLWANGTNYYGIPDTTATTGSASTCYDNGGSAGTTQQYSVEISSGNNVTCALSFRFQ